ncbi:putative f-box protein jemma [Fasciola gigantica]|uniref:Putative f-box protein jemma n=1 Tax=Fasciola gigantica TaxID=46835 RepID=A0A504Y909_FASGI|nr:putative f-box protein jemma [Fasciola gigantica]
MPLSGSQEFCDDLLRRQFLWYHTVLASYVGFSASGEVHEVSGYEINGHELSLRGFSKPLLVRNRDGLRIRVPPCSFLPSNLLSYIDSHHKVDVIDVREQTEIQMTLGELVEHFCSRPRTRLLNMLSFEFSQTRLSEVVQPPHVVSELSLITNCWVPDNFDEEVDDPSNISGSIPSVQKYCLLSMRGSYTDFHIDFGGSSVWYHGEKIFYLIPPTPENYSAYWSWSLNVDHRNIFFPDMLRKSQQGHSGNRSPVFQLRVLPGQTVLLPSGWIHAVYTPADCLVFGGNFLTELHIPSQLNIYHMEQKSGTPMKFQFPNFEKVHWFAADRIVGRLANTLQGDQDVRAYEVGAVRSLAKVLPRWYRKRRLVSGLARKKFLPIAKGWLNDGFLFHNLHLAVLSACEFVYQGDDLIHPRNSITNHSQVKWLI